MKRQVNRVLLDWGACHRLLDKLQVAVEHKELLPRVLFLVQHFAAQSGWPNAPDDVAARYFVPHGPKKDRKNDRKKR